MKQAFPIFFTLFLTPFLLVFSQELSERGDYNQWYSYAETLYESNDPTPETEKMAINLYRKTADYLADNNLNPLQRIDCLKKIGDVYLGGGFYNQAIYAYNEMLSVNSDKGLKDSLYDYQAKLYLGSAYYQSNILDSAWYFFENAAAYANHRTDLPDQSFLYNSLGVIYFESGNFLQAKNYFEQALPNNETLKEDDPYTYAGIYTNIATCLKSSGKLTEAVAIYKVLLPMNIASEEINYNLGNTYFLLKKYDSALFYFNAVKIGNKSIVVKKLNDIGRIRTEQGNWVLAEKIFDSAILINKQQLGSAKNKDMAYTYMYKAELAQKQGLTDEAIAWCNDALQALHFNFKWKRLTDLPPDETKVISPLVFFEVLRKKAGLLFAKYLHDQNPLLQESAMETYIKAIRVASFIKASFDNDDARLFFKEHYRDIYSDAIDVAYSLVEKKSTKAMDQFLQIMESYKGSVLYHNLLHVELKRSDAIPPEVINKEKALKQSLAAYITRLNNNPDQEDIRAIEERIISLEVEISRLQKLYEKYPEFEEYKRQSNATIITTGSVQEKLDRQTAVISFIFSKNHIYGIAITRNDVLVRRIDADSSLNKHIDYFLSTLYEHSNGKRYDGYEASAAIYDKLITPFLTAISNKPRWVILPDEKLNYMPFNALQENGTERHYLGERKVISNHYSLQLLFNNDKASNTGTEKPFIFAPFIADGAESKSNILPSLFSSAAEVAAFNGYSFTKDKATKANFLAFADKASVIHLSTHAIADIDSVNKACIFFYPSDTDDLSTKLYAPEIYNLDLRNTELVILSACETAFGKNATGEGLLSLTRGFLYAGSDGVISTFWKTDDRVSAYIMQQLHKYLKQGKTPEEALHLAKKDFLNNDAFDEHYKTPNYWATFIYIGNFTTRDTYTTWYYALALFLCISLVVFYHLRRKRKYLHLKEKPLFK